MNKIYLEDFSLEIVPSHSWLRKSHEQSQQQKNSTHVCKLRCEHPSYICFQGFLGCCCLPSNPLLSLQVDDISKLTDNNFVVIASSGKSQPSGNYPTSRLKLFQEVRLVAVPRLTTRCWLQKRANPHWLPC